MELGGCGNLVRDSDLVAVAPHALVAVTEIVPVLKVEGTLIVMDVLLLLTNVHPLGITQL